MNVFGPADHFRVTVWDGDACVGALSIMLTTGFRRS